MREEFKEFTELYRNGFAFDPEFDTFYTAKKSGFKLPKGYEDWNVEQINFQKFCSDRLDNLGITDEENKVELIGGVNFANNERHEAPVFIANKKGDIEITQYNLKRVPYTYMHMSEENNSSSNREEWDVITRLSPWHEKLNGHKYKFRPGAPIHPFWHKSLIESFEKKEQVETLVITEGQFKGFKASMDGLPTVGLTSISHYKDKKTNTIHSEIIEFIIDCEVKKLVILWDGDCKNISQKALDEKEDISTRPYTFYRYACNIRELLQEYKLCKPKNLQIYFATINSDQLNNNPKGIDDLLVEYKTNLPEIKREFDNIGNIPGNYITWINITDDSGVKKLRSFFNLVNVSLFYQYHQPQILEKEFIFQKTTYKVEKGVPVIKVDANIKNYKRIGTEYYKLIKQPLPAGKGHEIILEESLEPWSKSTIIEDHGKESVHHIEKYQGFTNIANHIDYQAVVENHWNLYYNIRHDNSPGEWIYIKKLLDHLFGEQYTLILDYLTMLYRFPMQKLPVICLVSKEQATGKSTFVYLLKLIFKQNMALISNNDLIGDFNSHWTSKLIVASEETMLEKREAYEKIKSLSTAKEIMRNEKNKTAKSIPCMVHFVFCSNHEDNFISIDDYDSRLWIRKVHTIKEKIKGFDEKIEQEIPQFVDFIMNREINYEDTGERMFFHPKDFRTDAFNNVVKHSEPSIIKELRWKLEDCFLKYGVTEIHMTVDNLHQYFGLRGENNYVSKTIKNVLKTEKVKDSNGKEKVTTYSFLIDDANDPNKTITIKGRGRPYVFHRKDFVSQASENGFSNDGVKEVVENQIVMF